MIKQNQQYKIALIGDSLSAGGAEKVHAHLSNFFVANGHQVKNCIFLDLISYKFSGELLNLGLIKPNSNPIIRKISRFFALKKFIKNNNFDVVIDFRMRRNFVQEFLISKIYPAKTIYSVRSGILEFYFPKNSFLSQLIYKNRTINCVSKAIQEKIIQQKLADNVGFIHNPIFFETIEKQKNEYQVVEPKYILAAGRMKGDVKQFDKLILAYSNSILPKENVKLILIGEGENKEKYIQLSKQLQLENFIQFIGFLDNPFPYYKSALFTVLSSKNEGFPNVIIESLACETPVIAFDCFSGPNEIISHEKNGLLLENQSFDLLKKEMNRMIEDKTLYKNCKENAKESVAKFDIGIIGNQWLELIKNTVS
jgi:glycosyltransferase involved in cell wall biosynthesis